MTGYKKWRFMWSEGGLQPKLEESLGVGGFGYPALVVLNGNKMKYSLLRGSFSAQGIGEYLKALTYGSSGGSPSIPLSALPQVVSVPSWDGNDLPPLDLKEEL
jgi:protein disulfide-isomerase A6